MQNTEYTPEQIDNFLTSLCDSMENKGWSLRKWLKKNKVSSKTFYKWLDPKEEDSEELAELKLERVKRYTRARDARADYIAEKVLQNGKKALDGTYDPAAVRVANDGLKWMAGKMRPTKYGNQIDITSGGEKINHSVYEVREVIVKQSNKVDGDEKGKE